MVEGRKSSHVRSSRKGRSVPKCPPLFAGFGRHPNSCERTLEEVRHDVQVGIWVEFALIFRSGQRQH